MIAHGASRGFDCQGFLLARRATLFMRHGCVALRANGDVLQNPHGSRRGLPSAALRAKECWRLSAAIERYLMRSSLTPTRSVSEEDSPLDFNRPCSRCGLVFLIDEVKLGGVHQCPDEVFDVRAA